MLLVQETDSVEQGQNYGTIAARGAAVGSTVVKYGTH